MIRLLAVVVVILATQAIGPLPPAMCVGAVHATLLAQVQHPEEKFPPDHWCQPMAKTMDKKAHACACHRECVDGDPNTIKEDPACTTNCDLNKCRCEVHGCP